MANALILLGVLASVTAFAEPGEPFPEEEWNRTFGRAGDDGAFSVQPALDGGFIITGYMNSYGAGSSDAWLIKAGRESEEKDDFREEHNYNH